MIREATFSSGKVKHFLFYNEWNVYFCIEYKICEQTKDMITVIDTEIEDVKILEPRIFNDSRGYFFESFSQREFEEKVCRTVFVQDNESRSVAGVVRGLHFQKPPYTQAKLVRAIHGAVLDVAVDIRRGSPTFGKHVAVELTADNHRQLFVPRGFAHGFAVLTRCTSTAWKHHILELSHFM